MRRKDVTIGMLLHAWTALWGEYVIKVTQVTNERPARVKGVVLKILKEADGDRAKADMLVIRPCESLQWLKDTKRRLDRLNLSDADYVIFDNGFLTPLNFDNGLRELSEEEVISAFGNQLHRRPKWDAEEAQKPRGEEWSAHEHVWDKRKREVIAK